MQDDETGTGFGGGAAPPPAGSGRTPGAPDDLDDPADGSGIGTDSSGIGTDSSGIAAEGSGIGAEGSGIGADGSGIGADGVWAGPGAGYAEPPRRRRRGRVAVYAGVAVLAASLGAAATVGLNSGNAAPSTGVSSHQVPGPGNDVGTTGRGTLNKAYVAAKAEPGVADIDAAIAYSGGTSSEGTGMVLSADGLVLTNNHVIDGARTINVTLPTTGKAFHATVVGYDATHDVALLRLTGAARLKVVQVGNSAQVTVGTPVLALGNAEGQGGTPATAEGIINSLNKTISPTDESTGTTETLHGMLQTNADIVSGDSGGPLVNSAGQVIGMDTANASSSQGSSSVLGYAIPINTALSVARQIAAGQASATVQIGLPGFLGVLVPQSGSASPQQQAQQQRQQIQQQQQGAGPGGPPSTGGNGQPAGNAACTNDDSDTTVPSRIAPARSGALVDGVLCGTAAAAAGIVSGDVITTVNGEAITTPGSLTAMMSGSRPGSKVTLRWETPSGQQQTATLALSAAPAK